MAKRLICLLVIFFFSFTKAQAQTEFATDYSVSYTVLSSGVTQTRFDISLINQLSNIYAREFSLSIGSTKLESITVIDKQGNNLPATINIGNKTTQVTIPFAEKVLGKDQSQDFSLHFNSLDFANKLGSVWEISIPKLSPSESLRNYQLQLAIPQSFGQPASLTPKPISITSSDGYNHYRFSPQDLAISGISATFGTSQFFDFSLLYHLQNPNIYPVKTEISLPPDTAFQQVLYQTLEPKPDDIRVDLDGNWLATYHMPAKQNLEILATGSAELTLSVRPEFPSVVEPISLDYLKPQKYWESDNPNIVSLAQKLENPKTIYQYVVDNLIYDYGRLTENTTRFGAANALDKPDSAICMEFTDLFVSLARASGTPARAVNGFAYTTNSALRPLSLKKDVLHAWPEYYNEKSGIWQPIDPTWGNTTGGVDFFSQLDLNHFTFAILGQDSAYPVPAGAYKLEGQETKDVHVDFGRSVTPFTDVALQLEIPSESLAGISLSSFLTISNNGNHALYDIPVTVKSEFFPDLNQTFQVPILPPFSSTQISLNIPATSWNENQSAIITATTPYSELTKTIKFKPAYILLGKPLVFLPFLFSLLGLALLFKLLKKRSKRH